MKSLPRMSAVAVGALFIAGVAHADMRMSVSVNQQGGGNIFDSGPVLLTPFFDNDPFFLYAINDVSQPSFADDDFGIDGQISGGTDISDKALLSPALTFSNESLGVLEFEVYIEWDVNSAAPVDWTTSFAWNSAGAGSEVNAMAPAAWDASLDGGTIAQLGIGAQLASDGDSEAFGPVAGSSGVVGSTMGVRLSFDLTPGHSVQYNGLVSVTEQVPAPGALALLGLAGLAGRRRRRA